MPNWSCKQYMNMMNIPQQYAPMMDMQQGQLESMFPRCYHKIYPEVCHHCDHLMAKHGVMFTPTRRQMDEVVDDIDNRVGMDVDADYRDFSDYNDYSDEYCYDDNCDRQFGVVGVGPFVGFSPFDGRRRFRRDLISIIFLNELLRRRHEHHHDFDHHGFPGGFGWY